MAVTLYRSTDTSAPTLSGTVGSLVALLDACLVVGYGSKTAAGWTKPFTATNKAVFRAGGGNQFYLDVDDAAPAATPLAREARLRGYETMSAVATGTGPFPTVAQIAGGCTIRKSTTADATARSWVILADNKTVYIFIASADTANVYLGTMFGDIYSLLTGDSYRTMLIGNSADNSTTDRLRENGAGAAVFTAIAGHYAARAYTGLGGSVQLGQHGDVGAVNAAAAGTVNVGVVPFPNPTDGGLYLARWWQVDPTTAPANSRRGYLRGLWHFTHPVTAAADGDTISGSDDLAGRTFLILKGGGSAAGIYCLETSNTWDTSS